MYDVNSYACRSNISALDQFSSPYSILTTSHLLEWTENLNFYKLYNHINNHKIINTHTSQYLVLSSFDAYNL